MNTCPCGSNLSYAECCLPVIRGEKKADTAVQLMRSRYSAYVNKEIDYIFNSLHPDHRADYDEKSTRSWAESAQWYGLEIISVTAGGPEDSEGDVEFIATFAEKGMRHEHHELSTFKKEDGIWYLVEGKTLPARQVVRESPKVGRNEPCPCGSGKKYKKCCGQ
ncbi:MAG: YchJ family protein [Thermodesulfovibrionales bacterium]